MKDYKAISEKALELIHELEFHTARNRKKIELLKSELVSLQSAESEPRKSAERILHKHFGLNLIECDKKAEKVILKAMEEYLSQSQPKEPSEIKTGIKLLFGAFLDLFLFRPVDFMERRLQIAYGVSAWVCVIIIIHCLIK